MSVTLPSGVDAIARAAAATPFDAVALCAAVDAFTQPVLRQRLCTVNRLDASQLRLTRVYSSNPAAYPPGGSKDKRGMPWGQHVLVDKKVFVGEGSEAIRASFDDADAIARLGLRSVINVPVVFAGNCLGTFNVLMTDEHVAPEHVEFARLAAQLLIPALSGSA